jgi:hypothetical protein
VIDQAMLLLRNTLNAHLTLAVPRQDASAEDAVVFLDGDNTDPISFKIGAVTMLLINVEQEPILRAANPYQRTGSDGTPYRSRPDIRLNLRVLFVARFKRTSPRSRRLPASRDTSASPALPRPHGESC